jgi:pimeloyl-ACP methyl ester carboxylesterase
VWFDPRGRGASQPLSPGENRIAETRSEDIVAVLEHLGWQRAALLAMGVAVPLMAATHPHRLSALVLVDTNVGGLGWSEPGRSR